MITEIQDFKRHYHKSRKVFLKLEEKGNIQLKIQLETNNLHIQFEKPISIAESDQDLAVQLAVLMQRFLNPTDSLYYQTFSQKLFAEYGKDIPEDLVEQIKGRCEELSNGGINLTMDGHRITSLEIYEMIAEGIYFNDDANARAALNGLTRNSIIKPILWYQFYSYIIDRFHLISSIFDAIQQLQNSSKYRKLEAKLVVDNPRCIYCLSSTNSFSSEEHIFPESLGNNNLILPTGYVCDKCNNGVLSELDKYLMNFEPIAFLKVLFVAHDKKGRLPKANFQNLKIEKTHPRHIKVQPKDRTGKMRDETNLGEGWVSWKHTFRGKPVNMKRLGRALFKICLGIIALDYGLDATLDQRFDLVRNFIIGKVDFPNNFLVCMKGVPSPNAGIRHHKLVEGEFCEINIYGLNFIMHLADKPILQLTEELRMIGFEAFPLHD